MRQIDEEKDVKISEVILVHNEKEILPQFMDELKLILGECIGYEMMVVDDGSQIIIESKQKQGQKSWKWTHEL